MEYRTRAGRRIQREYHEHLFRKYLGLTEAVLFNSLGETDRQAVIWIFKTKVAQDEFPEEIREDKLKCIEETSRLYIAQKCAFQDVLTKEGFDVVGEALKDYDGRIATLSNHGTFSIFGKPTRIGRLLTMKRAHSPQLDYNGSRGELIEDLKLGGIVSFHANHRGKFTSSYLRAIAINPHGPSDEGLEARAFQTIIANVKSDTLVKLALSQEELLSIHGRRK